MEARTLSFSRALSATSFKASLAFRSAFVLEMLFMVLNNFTFFVFWWVLMARVPSLRGWQIGDVQMLFGLVAIAFGTTVTLTGGVRHLGELIEDGGLDTLLTQPKPVLVYALGLRLKPSGFGDVLTGLILVATSGRVSIGTIPLLVTAVAASAAVILACGIVFFSLAFWLGPNTVARQLWELLITFSLYPEPLFGGGLRFLLFTALPAGLVGYLPARIVRAPTASDVILLASGAALYFVGALLIFQAGLRRYSSGSRFTTFG
jgi:ABC-2 type transport system permease protein